MFACIAINKAAEPNSLMIRVPSFEQRDDLIAEQPEVYYLKPHYEPYPCVLVRLGRVHADALRDLLRGAWRDASARRPRKAAKRKRTADEQTPQSPRRPGCGTAGSGSAALPLRAAVLRGVLAGDAAGLLAVLLLAPGLAAKPPHRTRTA